MWTRLDGIGKGSSAIMSCASGEELTAMHRSGFHGCVGELGSVMVRLGSFAFSTTSGAVNCRSIL